MNATLFGLNMSADLKWNNYIDQITTKAAIFTITTKTSKRGCERFSQILLQLY